MTSDGLTYTAKTLNLPLTTETTGTSPDQVTTGTTSICMRAWLDDEETVQFQYFDSSADTSPWTSVAYGHPEKPQYVDAVLDDPSPDTLPDGNALAEVTINVRVTLQNDAGSIDPAINGKSMDIVQQVYNTHTSLRSGSDAENPHEYTLRKPTKETELDQTAALMWGRRTDTTSTGASFIACVATFRMHKSAPGPGGLRMPIAFFVRIKKGNRWITSDDPVIVVRRISSGPKR